MIKFLDIKKITDSYQPGIAKALENVADSGFFIRGKEVKNFEEAYAGFIGSAHCVGVGNGFDALRLIFKAWLLSGAIREGDEVIVPANTYIASVLAIALYYLDHVNNPGIILLLQLGAASEHVWHLFVVRCIHRDELQQYLAKNGIETLIHYPIPPHKQLAYKDLNHLTFPITERIHREVLSLPISPVIEEWDLRRIVEVVNEFKVD